MIVIPVKEGENVERALKRFKRKFDRGELIALEGQVFLEWKLVKK